MQRQRESSEQFIVAMKKIPSSSWSESLQRQTRDALVELPLTPDGKLHFKHHDHGFAHASYDEVYEGPLTLHNSRSEHVYRFDTVDDLLQAGWAID